jgi:hypothetical protein
MVRTREQRKIDRERRRRLKEEKLKGGLEKSKQTIKDIQGLKDPSKISKAERPTDKFGEPLTDSELSQHLKEQFPDRKEGDIARTTGELTPEQRARTQTPGTKFFQGESGVPLTVEEGEQLKKFSQATPEQLQKFKEQGAVSQDVIDRIQKQQEIPTTDAEILAASETGGEIPKARELADTGVQAFEGLELPGTDKGLIQTLGDTPLGQAFAGKAALKNLRKEGQLDNIVEMTDFMLDNGLTPEQITNDPSIQMFLKLQLNELDVKLIKQGEQDISFLAQLVEGLPVIGGIARKHFGGAITPTIAAQRVDDLASNIQQMGNTVRDYRMAAARTPANKDVYLELLEETEIEIKNAESRMKLLIIQSPTLQNSPEEVETLQSKTNRALNRIGDARNAMILGETLEQAMAQTAQEQTL